MTALVHRRLRVRVRNNYFSIETVTRGAPGGRHRAADGPRPRPRRRRDGLRVDARPRRLHGLPGRRRALGLAPRHLRRARLPREAHGRRRGPARAARRPRRAGRSPFAEEGYRALRAAVLLGDSFRAGADPLRYPINWRAAPAPFARAVFADHTLHLAHATNRAQRDLGTYACPRAAVLTAPCVPYDPSAVPTADAAVSASFLAGDEWTSTGRYALAGRAFRLRRTDATGGRLYARVGFAREGTTRAFEVTGTTTRYDRPQHLVSPWVELTAGREVELSWPLGGPIYLRLVGSAALAGMPATVETAGRRATRPCSTRPPTRPRASSAR
jgi:hypothetical protein